MSRQIDLEELTTPGALRRPVGRPRKHASAAAKQAAYRLRQKLRRAAQERA